jgi:hypothetical protein
LTLYRRVGSRRLGVSFQAASTAALRQAVVARSDAERAVKNAVYQTRQHGYSWIFIGTLIGTSGEAARQRYRHQ